MYCSSSYWNFLSKFNINNDNSDTMDEFNTEYIGNLKCHYFIVDKYLENLIDIFVDILTSEQDEDSELKDDLHSKIFLWFSHLSSWAISKFIPFLPKLMPLLKIVM